MILRLGYELEQRLCQLRTTNPRQRIELNFSVLLLKMIVINQRGRNMLKDFPRRFKSA